MLNLGLQMLGIAAFTLAWGIAATWYIKKMATDRGDFD